MIDANDYVVAIPTWHRADTIAGRSLVALAEGGIDSDRIHLFVADAVEAADYRRLVDPALYGHIEVVDYDPYEATDAPPGREPQGLAIAVNAIHRHWPTGHPIIKTDDDLAGLWIKTDEKRRTPLADLHAFVLEGFAVADHYGAHLWGVYAVPNPFFQKHRIRLGLCYIPGGWYGLRPAGDDADLVDLAHGHDFALSIQRWVADGVTVRFDDVSMRTEGYRGRGGMVEQRTADLVDTSARIIAARWPDHASLNLTKKSGWTEVRLRSLPSPTHRTVTVDREPPP